MAAHIFREYDIRGAAEQDLTDDLTRRIGRGLAEVLGKDADPSAKQRTRRIVVARDCRLSGERIHRALTQGLMAGGVEVLDVGVGPTPKMYFGVHHLKADGGVMITGSHNPPDENGFKMMSGTASFFGDQIRKLGETVEQTTLPDLAGGSLRTVAVDDEYVDALTRDIAIKDPALAFVVDGGNGAAGPHALRALHKLGLRPIALFCEMDGRFPNHHPDPTVAENLQDLIAAMKQNGARVGIAWDGDGDRLGVVDQSGEIVWGDRLLAVFARSVLGRAPGAKVLGDVKSSQYLFDDIAKHGGQPIMWKTGHSLIKAKMKEENALIAGEMSGHFFFRDRYFGYDDGIYAALRLLEILSQTGQTIQALLADLPRGASTPEIRVGCPERHKFEVVERMRAHFRSKAQVSEIDGARIGYGDGAWGLVRASNTGATLVLRFEAPTPERLRDIRDQIEGVLATIKAQVARELG